MLNIDFKILAPTGRGSHPWWTDPDPWPGLVASASGRQVVTFHSSPEQTIVKFIRFHQNRQGAVRAVGPTSYEVNTTAWREFVDATERHHGNQHRRGGAR